jgi:hypothetical protein
MTIDTSVAVLGGMNKKLIGEAEFEFRPEDLFTEKLWD